MKRILIDKDLCIGCEACYRSCTNNVVKIELHNDLMTMELSETCPEECFDCKEICPVGAIRFTTFSDYEPSQTLSFKMVRCSKCNKPFTTEKIIQFLQERLSEGLYGKDICLSCRRTSILETAL